MDASSTQDSSWISASCGNSFIEVKIRARPWNVHTYTDGCSNHLKPKPAGHVEAGTCLIQLLPQNDYARTSHCVLTCSEVNAPQHLKRVYRFLQLTQLRHCAAAVPLLSHCRPYPAKVKESSPGLACDQLHLLIAGEIVRGPQAIKCPKLRRGPDSLGDCRL